MGRASCQLGHSERAGPSMARARRNSNISVRGGLARAANSGGRTLSSLPAFLVLCLSRYLPVMILRFCFVYVLYY
jgi:hypothetical protein